jgi:hypothetical protein
VLLRRAIQLSICSEYRTEVTLVEAQPLFSTTLVSSMVIFYVTTF